MHKANGHDNFAHRLSVASSSYQSFPTKLCLSPALLIRAKGVCRRGNHQNWSNLAVFRENRHDEGSVVMRFRGAVSGAVQAVWDARRQLLGMLAAVLGQAEALRAPPLHERATRRGIDSRVNTKPSQGLRSLPPHKIKRELVFFNSWIHSLPGNSSVVLQHVASRGIPIERVDDTLKTRACSP